MNTPLLSQDAINEIYNKKIDSETKLSVLKDLNNKVKEQKLPENFITYQEYKDSLIKRLEKNKLFDFRWSSLISSNPLLFEDNHYLRIKKLVRFNKEQYEKEQEMFRNGEINHIYNSLDQLLLCNLKYYDRIMNYILMVAEKYIMLPDDEDELSDEEMFKDVIQELEMTPTQLYCASMINPETTTIRELEYGFSLKKGSIKPITEEDIEDGIIKDASYVGVGCASSQASTSLMIDLIKGKTLDEAKELCETFLAMITEGLEGDELKKLKDAIALQNISTMPARVKCAVLAWHTLKNIIEAN